MIDELFECDAISLTEQIKTGIVEASDMLSASIARAERLNTSLHAIVNFNTSQAKKLLAKTALDTPLYGVPTLLKDLGAEAINFILTMARVCIRIHCIRMIQQSLNGYGKPVLFHMPEQHHLN